MEIDDKNEFIKKINIRLGVITKKYEDQLKLDQMKKLILSMKKIRHLKMIIKKIII